MMSGKHCIILGGGFSGLTAAYFLRKKAIANHLDLKISLIEGSSRLGGIIQTKHDNGFLYELGPDAFITDRKWALDLAGELGLESEIIPTQSEKRRSFVYQDGKLQQTPEGFYLFAPTNVSALWKSNLFTFPEKVRINSELFIPKKDDDEDESIAAFIRRRFGTGMYEKYAQAMVGGIYSGNPESLSMRSCFNRFVKMEQEHGSIIKGLLSADSGTEAMEEASGPRYSMFVSFKKGMESFVDGLIKQLDDIEIHLNARVSMIRQDKNWSVRTSDGSEYSADSIYFALPSFESARILRPLSMELANDLLNIPYESVVSCSVGFKEEQVNRPVNGFGFVMPVRAKKNIMGCTVASNKFSNRAPEDSVLFRIFSGGAMNRELLVKNDEEIEHLIIAELKDILSIDSEPTVKYFKRWNNAMPQFNLGHNQKIKRIKKSISDLNGIYMGGNFMDGIGLPHLAHQSEENAGRIINNYLASVSGAN